MELESFLKRVIKDVPDFPQPGILFRDLTPVLEDPAAFGAALDGMRGLLASLAFDKLAAMEARGFLFGAPLAASLGKGLILLRKAGKLPRPVQTVRYDLEYGQAILQMHCDSCGRNERVVIVDDLLATGGTARAAGQLIRQVGAEVSAYLFVVELCSLDGRALLTDAPVHSLVAYR